jgi:glycine/D-amino acid oxidase-like deaminating enzyme
MRPRVVVIGAGLGGLAAAIEAAHGGAEVTILEDDYAAALGKAKARGVLLFVDGWAPWCHSCVFFREHVLPNASLGDLADRYVFASIDT